VSPAAPLLDAQAVEAALAELPSWQGDTHAIRRSVRAPSFSAGIRLVDDVAVVADELDHHPDIDIRWTTVTLSLSTHVSGGVTERDVELARRIDELVERHGCD
jgi:4a-hydroxytetrahydrobiopterin dehydratase